MNTLFKRVLAVAIGILTLGMSAAYSQSVKDIERESLSAFTGIKLGGDFVLDLRYGTLENDELVGVEGSSRRATARRASTSRAAC